MRRLAPPAKTIAPAWNSRTSRSIVCRRFCRSRRHGREACATTCGARPLQPGLLLLDEAVTRARAVGCALLNFESSPGVDSSVYQFKARCGGQPVSYQVFVALLAPQALGEYRNLGADGLRREAPNAF